MNAAFLFLTLLILQASPAAPPNSTPSSASQQTALQPANSTPQGPVVISELPPVAITADSWTKAYVICTALLVIVAAVGLILVLRTLRAVKAQTVLLRHSTVQARRAADAARQSATTAEKTLRLIQRADVLLESVAPTFVGEHKQFTGDSRIIFKFKNYGPTRASDVSFRVRLVIPSVPDKYATPLSSMVMGANQEQSVAFSRLKEFLTESIFDDITHGRITMQFESWLLYRDVFGASYETKDVGAFDPKTLTFNVQEHTSG
jgi:hypothetical protein